MSTDSLTIQDLRSQAKALGLKYAPKNTKADLLAMIEAAQGDKGEEVQPEAPEKAEVVNEGDKVEFEKMIPPDAPNPVSNKAKREPTEEDGIVQDNGQIIAEWFGSKQPVHIYCDDLRGPAKTTVVTMTGTDGKVYKRQFYRVKATPKTKVMFKGLDNVRILKKKQYDETLRYALYTADQENAKRARRHLLAMQSEGINVAQ